MGGKSSKIQVTAQDRAILDLKVQRDRLKQCQKKISSVLDREMEIAKEFIRQGHKDRALFALQKKKYQQVLLEQVIGQLGNIEKLVDTIEFKMVEKEVFEGLKKGNKILGELQKELQVEQVEMVLSEAGDYVRYHQEIGEMIAGTLNEQDHEELENELSNVISELMIQVPKGEISPVESKFANTTDTNNSNISEELKERQLELAQ